MAISFIDATFAIYGKRIVLCTVSSHMQNARNVKLELVFGPRKDRLKLPSNGTKDGRRKRTWKYKQT